MTGSARQFGALLLEAVQLIAVHSARTIAAVQDELGYAIGREGGSAIRYWSYGHGHIPRTLTEVERLAAEVASRGGLERLKLQALLESAGHPAAERVTQEILGLTATAAVIDPQRAKLGASDHLPATYNLFVGRERECAVVKALLAQEHVRLVTLTGPGGVGKTRLALHVAHELADHFADGVHFVDLTPIHDPALVVPTIAQSVGLREMGRRAPAELLHDYLRGRTALLLLDNCEQVVEAAAEIAGLLDAGSAIKVLTTSREALRLRAEHLYPVQPLALPDPTRTADLGYLNQVDSVILFVERARAANPAFDLAGNAADVARICTQLDGLPLAIELAAGHVKLFPPFELVKRIGDRFALLQSRLRDLPERHRTLQQTIAWSHDLLTAEEKVVFRRLAVFEGGCTLAAAQTVCSLDGELDVVALIESLLDKNLVCLLTPVLGEPRIGMLEIVRAYALSELRTAQELERVQEAHAHCVLALAQQLGSPSNTAEYPMRITSLETLAAEIDNFRALFRWSIQTRNPMFGLQLAWPVSWLWITQGYNREGGEWLAQLMRMDGVAEHSITFGRALICAGGAAMTSGAHAQAQALLAHSAEICASLGATAEHAEALLMQGWTAYGTADYAPALALFQAALSELVSVDQRWLDANAHMGVALVQMERNNYLQAQSAFETGISIATRYDLSLTILDLLSGLGYLHLAQGQSAAAAPLFERSLARSHALRERRSAAYALAGLALVKLDRGELIPAHMLCAESLAICRDIGERDRIATPLVTLCVLFQRLGKPQRAVRLAGAITALRAAMGRLPSRLEQSLLEPALRAARSTLGGPVAETAWSAGANMGWEELIALALSLGDTDDRSGSL